MSNTLLNTIETDLVAAWGTIEGTVEKDALVLWNDAKTIFVSLLPAQYTILTDLLSKIVATIEGGKFADVAAIETALLNDSSVVGSQELAWVVKLGSQVLQAFIALFKVNA